MITVGSAKWKHKCPARWNVISSLKPLAEMVWDTFDYISFLSVNAKVFSCIPKNDPTEKYSISAGCGG